MASPADFMNQTVSYALITGRDSFGKPTLGTVTASKARVQPHRKLIRDARGKEALTSHVIYLPVAVDLNTVIWPPGANTADVNQARRVLDVDTEVDGAGVTQFAKVYLG